MKCISVWQPWASAIACGAKLIETRSWPTNHRGLVLIHASKRCNKAELLHYKCCWNWCGVLRQAGLVMGGDQYLDELLPFGAVVAVAELVACSMTDNMTIGELRERRLPAGEAHEIYSWTEEQLGDYSTGRYAWRLAGVRPFRKPVPYKGAQGLFEVPWTPEYVESLING